MPDFAYTARETTGREVRGVLSAATESEAAATLTGRELFPVRITPAKANAGALRIGRGKVKARQLATLYQQLADLLTSGVPLLRSLELLERQSAETTLGPVLKEIRQQIADGTRLNRAMAAQPHVFSDLAISIVKAGEEGGFLEDVLARLAAFTEHQEELKGRITGAVAYPAFLLVFGTIVVAVLIVYFVPQFAPMFERMEEGSGLPWSTRILLGFSDLMQTWWWLAFALLVGGSVLLRRAFQTEAGRQRLDRWKLSAPGAGNIYRSLAISRFCRILGTLLHNGVPILNALRIAKDASGNSVLRDAVATAADNISQGESLAGPLGESQQFPSEIVEMIAVGEEANNLDHVLVNIADSLERRTWRQLDLFVRLLEPLMLLVMASVILFVVIALLLPIFQSSGSI